MIPVMTGQPDRDEHAYWISKGWDPELQLSRMDQLGDLGVPRPWNKARRDAYRTRVEALKAEQHDAAHIDHKQATRMVLAKEKVISKPSGVEGVAVVAAYNSLSALTQDFPVADVKDHVGAQAYLLSRRLAVPDLPAEVLVREAVKLSSDKDFRRRRSDLFDWQELAAARRWSPQETVERTSDMTDRYNAKVREALEPFAGDSRSRYLALGSDLPVAVRSEQGRRRRFHWSSLSNLTGNLQSRLAAPNLPRCSTISKLGWESS